MKKIRGRTMTVFVFAVLSGAGLLHVSQNVQEAEDRLAALEAKYRAEHETIRVLNAEWAYLNSPARLEALSHDYLDLDALKPNQMMPELKALPPIYDDVSENGGNVLQHISTGTMSADETSVVLVPPPGRKPRSQKGDFGALLNGLSKRGAQ